MFPTARPTSIPACGTVISSQALALLQYFPEPNLAAGNSLNNNYHLLTTGQSNTTNAGIRYNRSLGPNATQPGGRGGSAAAARRRRIRVSARASTSTTTSRTRPPIWSISFRSWAAKSASDSYSLQAGYTVGYHRFTNIFNSNWNRSNAHTINFFTDTSVNPAEAAGINVPNNVPLNYGVPAISLSNGIQGLSETQPSFSISQTISFSEVLSWIHGKHNMRYRRRLPPRASRLPRRLQRHRQLRLYRPVH